METRTYASETELMAAMDTANRAAVTHQAVLDQLQALEVGDMTSTTARRLRTVADELHIDPPHPDVPDDAIWAVRRTATGFEIEEWRRP